MFEDVSKNLYFSSKSFLIWQISSLPYNIEIKVRELKIHFTENWNSKER